MADSDQYILEGNTEPLGRRLCDDRVGTVSDFMVGDLDPDMSVALQPNPRGSSPIWSGSRWRRSHNPISQSPFVIARGCAERLDHPKP